MVGTPSHQQGQAKIPDRSPIPSSLSESDFPRTGTNTFPAIPAWVYTAETAPKPATKSEKWRYGDDGVDLQKTNSYTAGKDYSANYNSLEEDLEAGKAKQAKQKDTANNKPAAVENLGDLCLPPSEVSLSVEKEEEDIEPELTPVDVQQFNEGDAMMCLERHINTTWFGKRNMKNHTSITSISFSTSFIVRLSSWDETRKVMKETKPYIVGTLVDDSRYGPSPQPWSIPVNTPPPYTDHLIKIPMPHTEQVMTCHGCQGRGETMCGDCNGSGQQICSHCNGQGFTKESHFNHGTRNHEWRSVPCTFCFQGKAACATCLRRGVVVCSLCIGNRNLVHFLMLHVDFTNKTKEILIDPEEDSETVPLDNLSTLEGPLLYAEEHVNLSVRDAEAARVNEKINEAINAMISSERNPGALRHRQKVYVHGVPIYKNIYMWNGAERKFWVVGTNQRVVAPNIPLDGFRIGMAIAMVLLVLLLVFGLIGGGVYFVISRSNSVVVQ